MGRLRSWLVPVLLAAAQLALWPGTAWAGLWGTAPVRPISLAAGVASTVVAAVAVGWRRSAPVPVLCIVTLAVTLGVVGTPDYALSVISVADLIALFSVAVHCRTFTTVGATIALVCWQTVVIVSQPGSPESPDIVVLLLVAGFGIGRRRWRAERRAAADRLIQAEAEQRQAASAERRRLARELHDVGAHHLTSIVVTAGAAERLADRQPQLAAEALDFAGSTGRETLVALNRLVAVMRTAEDDDAQPLRDRLDDLASGFARLGIVVDVTVTDDEPAIPDGAARRSLAADDIVYAVAREALTNAVRYAPGAGVRVQVEQRDGTRELRVDNGSAREVSVNTSLGSGRGLAGAGERVTAVGGTLEAGPLPDGGWRVRARLPTAASAVPRRRGWLRDRHAIDAAIVLAVGVLPVFGSLGVDTEATIRSHGGVVALLTLVMLLHALPLAWRRRAPWAALGATLATGWIGALAVAFRLLPPDMLPVLLLGCVAELVAVHAVARYGRRGWTNWVAAPAAALGVAAPPVIGAAADGSLAGTPSTIGEIVTVIVTVATIMAVTFSVVWGDSYLRRVRRDRVRAREDSALAVATDAALVAAHAERRKIAAELHSTVLDRAERVVAVAEEGRLDAVIDEARATLTAMRELLGTLRGAATRGERCPQPTIAALDGLYAEYRAAGREVTLHRPTEAPALAADVELSAFRIVETALGAGDATPAHVRLEYGHDELTILADGVPRVADGPAAAGLQARVTALGGRMVVDRFGTLRVALPALPAGDRQADPVTG